MTFFFFDQYRVNRAVARFRSGRKETHMNLRYFRHSLPHLRALEAEAIHILRETAAQFERPVLLYSIGKDSSVMVHLARKAFFPGRIPFPLMHIDTGYEYPEMIAFRDWFVDEIGARLIVHTNRSAPAPGRIRTISAPRDAAACCARRRCWTRSANIGRTRRWAARAATKSDRAPKSASSRSAMSTASGIRRAQRPELWSLYNGRVSPGEHIRVFPLSNWTELDVWSYIESEEDPGAVPVLRAGPAGGGARRFADPDRVGCPAAAERAAGE